MRGHEGTVKVATWDPNHRDLLSTGGRDGLICVWDLRSAERRTGDKLSPVLTITKAHEANPAPRKSVKAVPKSVTGVIYNPTSDNELISGGSADGYVFHDQMFSRSLLSWMPVFFVAGIFEVKRTRKDPRGYYRFMFPLLTLLLVTVNEHEGCLVYSRVLGRLVELFSHSEQTRGFTPTRFPHWNP